METHLHSKTWLKNDQFWSWDVIHLFRNMSEANHYFKKFIVVQYFVHLKKNTYVFVENWSELKGFIL